MLGCWASKADLASAHECRESAKRLHECMSKPVRLPFFTILRLEGELITVCFAVGQNAKGKARVPTVNFALARFAK